MCRSCTGSKLLGEDADNAQNTRIRNKIMDYYQQDLKNFDHSKLKMYKTEFIGFAQVVEMLKLPVCYHCGEDMIGASGHK
jgi:hypothetical protein